MDHNLQKLSVIIPAYNEAATIEEVLRRVEAAEAWGLKKEIIVVDDCSRDKTGEAVRRYGRNVRLISQPVNRGKGAALIEGFRAATGDLILIQDADLEYNPSDYRLLLMPIIEGEAQVVYGSRFTSPEPKRVLFFHHYLANRFITFVSNVFTNLNLTDIETGYKVFRREVIKSILPRLSSPRFGIEVELTARVAQGRFRVYEVGIAYAGRTYEEGKKITWRDGLAALWHILRFNLVKPPKSLLFPDDNLVEAELK
jgi:glycosyltransferase involved in cell wall biosynthesis